MPPPPKIKIVKTLSKQLLVHDVRGMPRSLAEQGAEGFRSLCDSFDIEASRLEQTCPGIEKALEQSPLAALLRGKLAERNNQHRFRHAAVYVSYMHKELAFVHRAQFSVEAGDKNAGKGKQLNTPLLPHRLLLRYLDIPTALPLAQQTTALQGMEVWLSLHNQTQLWGGKQFDQELLNSYSLDWPYAIFALQKIVDVLQNWSSRCADEKAATLDALWALLLLCAPHGTTGVTEHTLLTEWGVPYAEAQEIAKAYRDNLVYPTELFHFAPLHPAQQARFDQGEEACTLDVDSNLFPSAIGGFQRAYLQQALFPDSQTEQPLLPSLFNYFSFAVCHLAETFADLLPQRLAEEVEFAQLFAIAPDDVQITIGQTEAAELAPHVLRMTELAVLAIQQAVVDFCSDWSQQSLTLALQKQSLAGLIGLQTKLAPEHQHYGAITQLMQQLLQAQAHIGLKQAYHFAQWQYQWQTQLEALQQLTAEENDAQADERKKNQLKTTLAALHEHSQTVLSTFFPELQTTDSQTHAEQQLRDLLARPELSSALRGALQQWQQHYQARVQQQQLPSLEQLQAVLEQANQDFQHLCHITDHRQQQWAHTLADLTAKIVQLPLQFPLQTLTPIENEMAESAEPDNTANGQEQARKVQKKLDKANKLIHDLNRSIEGYEKQKRTWLETEAKLRSECRKLEQMRPACLTLPGGNTLADLASGLVRMLGSDKSPEAVLDAASRFCENKLLVLDSARHSARNYMRNEYSPQDLMQSLLKLALEYLPNYLIGGDNMARNVFGQSYSARESDTVKNDKRMREQREFLFKGQKRLFQKHLSLNSYLRLYFEVEQDNEQIVIAYLGEHLDCTMTN